MIIPSDKSLNAWSGEIVLTGDSTWVDTWQTRSSVKLPQFQWAATASAQTDDMFS